MRERSRRIKNLISIILVVNMCINLFGVSGISSYRSSDFKDHISYKKDINVSSNSESTKEVSSSEEEVLVEEKKVLSVEEAVDIILEEQQSDEFRDSANISDDVVMFVMKSNKGAFSEGKLNDDSKLCKEYGLYDVEFITEVCNANGEAGCDDEFLISYKAKTKKDVWNVIDKLNKREDILGAEPGYKYESMAEVSSVPTYNTAPYMQMQWYLDELGMVNNWYAMEDNGYNPGENVTVAVIDTGVLFTHEALKSAIWTNKDEIAGNGIDDDRNGYVDDYFGVNVINPSKSVYDDNGHGTSMSGIIAMQAVRGRSGAGIAYNAKIMPIKAADAKGEFQQDDVAEGINYAVLNGADIINMSFGGEKSLVIEVAAKNAYSKGVVLVAAAGNDGVPTTDGERYFSGKYDSYDNYPAASSYVIGVMAYNQTDSLCKFSNWDYKPGNNIEYDVIAPGSNMYSTDISENQYAYTSGTSAATAVVSALAANYRSIYKDKTKYKNTYIIAKLKAGKEYVNYTDLNGKLHKYKKVNADLKTVANTYGKFNIGACTVIPSAYTYVYTGSFIEPSVVVKTANAVLSKDIYYTVEYENNIKVGRGAIIIKPVNKNAYGTKKIYFNIIPPAIENVKVYNASESALSLSWDYNENCDGYDVYRYNSVEKKYKFIKRLNGSKVTKYSDAKLNSGIIYYYKVRGYKVVNNVKYYTTFSQVAYESTKLKSTTMVYNSVSSKAIKLAWFKVTGATGYELYKYSATSRSYKKIAILPATVRVYNDTNLMPLTKYYYVVRAYKKVKDEVIYSAYSPKIGAYTGPMKIQGVKITPEYNKKVLLQWNKSKDVSGYQIYVSKSKNGSYRHVSNIASKYIKVRVVSVPTTQIYYYKVRAYKKVNGKFVYGDFSEPVYGRPKG